MKYEALTVVAERGAFVLIGGGAILLGYGLVTYLSSHARGELHQSAG